MIVETSGFFQGSLSLVKLFVVTIGWLAFVWCQTDAKSFRRKALFLVTYSESNLFFPCPFPFSFYLFCSSWLVVSLTWRWTSSSRMQRPSSACWSCWNTVKSHARQKSGACLPPSCARVSATCRPALRSASFRGYCSNELCGWHDRRWVVSTWPSSRVLELTSCESHFFLFPKAL